MIALIADWYEWYEARKHRKLCCRRLEAMLNKRTGRDRRKDDRRKRERRKSDHKISYRQEKNSVLCE